MEPKKHIITFYEIDTNDNGDQMIEVGVRFNLDFVNKHGPSEIYDSLFDRMHTAIIEASIDSKLDSNLES